MNKELDLIEKQVSGFLNTPPLWDKTQFEIEQFEFPEIDLNGFVPEAIPSKLRLGHQMEYIFKQLITYSNHYKVLVHNLPIRRGKETLGEIDFILKNLQSDTLIHVELTYKFYIINPEIPEQIYRLVGPNKRDIFVRKMEKIKNIQIKLLHSIEGVKILDYNNINNNLVSHKTCFKAQLFIPFNQTDIDIQPFNKNCIYGYWLRRSEFNIPTFIFHEFYIPTKSEWVILPHLQVPWKSHTEVSIEINNHLQRENSPLVWMKKSTTEFEKFFVIHW